MNFDKDVIIGSQDEPIIAMFTASWCPPCKVMKPMLRQVSSSRNDFKLSIIDIDANIDLAKRFSVRSVPTILLFKDGKPIERYRGGFSPSVFNGWLNSVLGGAV
jgi:putative thioredoxin